VIHYIDTRHREGEAKMHKPSTEQVVTQLTLVVAMDWIRTRTPPILDRIEWKNSSDVNVYIIFDDHEYLIFMRILDDGHGNDVVAEVALRGKGGEKVGREMLRRLKREYPGLVAVLPPVRSVV